MSDKPMNIYDPIVARPFIEMASATKTMPTRESLISRAAPDQNGGMRLIEITAGDLQKLAEFLEKLANG
jgi:hypothetical protein